MMIPKKKQKVSQKPNIPLPSSKQPATKLSFEEQKQLLLKQIASSQQTYQHKKNHLQTLRDQNKQLETKFAFQTKRLAQVRIQIRKIKQSQPKQEEIKPSQPKKVTKTEKRSIPPNYSLYNSNNVDVDNMSYEELIQLTEKIGNVSVGLKQKEIEDLKRDTFNNLGQVDEKCAICMNEYEGEDVLIVLPCKHCFHEECISTWVADNKSCPLCKESIV